MGKAIVLKIVGGDFDSGFSVGLQVWEERGGFPSADKSGYLPPHPHLEGYYFNWQTSFRKLNGRNRSDDFGFDDNLPYGYSSDDDREACHKFAKLLEQNMKTWLLETIDVGWQQIREKFVEELAENRGNVRITIQADPKLWKMPWLEWDILLKYPDLGIGFSPLEYQKPDAIARSGKQGAAVRILAVFGNNENIDLEPDKRAIAQLPNVELEPLEQPSAAEVIQKLRDKRGWDIFFFAGHSQTKGDEGIIYINERESLEIGQFKEALKEAIRQGLQLAIFNSCDGLGLAEKLATLQLPIAIVMKEPVPDKVAQRFLTEFLTEYAAGAYLYTAVRRSQKCLEEFAEFPGCTGLPIVCQNPAEVPPTWEELRGRKPIPPVPRPQLFPFVPGLYSFAIRSLSISIICTAIVMVGRSFGLLELWEFKAYDVLMRMRPNEGPDPRIVLIGLTEEDVQSQPAKERMGASISDRKLDFLLAKLERGQPRTIGLSIEREYPVGSNYAGLAHYMKNTKHFIGICQYGKNRKARVPKPPEVPSSRVGFNNVLPDPDRVIRRNLLGISSFVENCQNYYSFTFNIAKNYLTAEKVDLEIFEKGKFIYFRVGSKVSKILTKNAGGYYDLNTRGYQIMLNYRTTPYIATQFNLSEVLSDNFNLDIIKDKIVIIGTIDPSFKNHQWYTPYSGGQWPLRGMTGIEVQAHMVSEIISTALDNRPFIWWLPDPLEAIWIWGWSLAGGVLIGLIRSPGCQAIAEGVLVGVLCGSCLYLLVQGGWVPLVPSALALVATGGIRIVSERYHSFSPSSIENTQLTEK